MQAVIKCIIFLFALLHLNKLCAQSPWPSSTWSAAVNLTPIVNSGGILEASGLFYNANTKRLYVSLGQGGVCILQFNTITNSFFLVANIPYIAGPEGITQVNLNANEFYTADENNYQIRKYTYPANYSSVTLVNSWNLLIPPSTMPNTGNKGPEGIAFVPDSFLSAIGFISPLTGSVYTSVKGMGGLIFIANQTQGYVWVYDVNPNVSNDFAFVGKYKTNQEESCDLAFDRSTGLLYILHNIGNNSLEVTNLTTTPYNGTERKFVVKNEYAIPNSAGTNTNVEGFAISPKCTDTSTTSVWLCRDVESTEPLSYQQDCLRWFHPFYPVVVPSVSIVVSPGNTICSGTSLTFTATPVNGGVLPVYQWKKNGNNVGTNSPSYTSNALVNGDIITCVLFSSESCPSLTAATSNSISMTVNTSVTPSVTISANPGTTICSGTNATFTATPLNGGTTPSYQWKRNGTNVGTNSNTYSNNSLANNNSISCVMTSNASCISSSTATSNQLTITVSSSVVPSVSISANPGTTICSGTNATFTATPLNGGTTPSYQWKRNGTNVGTNSNTYSNNSLANNNSISCVMTSNAVCALSATSASNSLTMTVNSNVTPSVSISANPGTTICSGTNVVLTATPVYSGSNPSYQWKCNGTNVGTNNTNFSTTTLADNDNITCNMICNTGCNVPNQASSGSKVFSVNQCGFTLNLRVYLQGFYKGSGKMRAVIDSVNHPTLCDTITVELHNPTSPFNVVYSAKATIDIFGNGVFPFPDAVLFRSYYIVVRHRNSLETWSKFPQLANSTTLSYYFH